MLDIPLLISLLISLTELKNIHLKNQIKGHTRKFKKDKMTSSTSYLKCNLEQRMMLAEIGV